MNDLPILASGNTKQIVALLMKRAAFGRSKQADMLDDLKGHLSQAWQNYGAPAVSKVQGVAGDAMANAAKTQVGQQVSDAWKNNPVFQNSVYGAGIGGALGLGSGLMSRKNKGRAVGDALTGALLGAGAGGAGTYVANNYLANKPEAAAAPAAPGEGFAGGAEATGNTLQNALANPVDALHNPGALTQDAGVRGALQGAGMGAAARGAYEGGSSLLNKATGRDPANSIYKGLLGNRKTNEGLIGDVSKAFPSGHVDFSKNPNLRSQVMASKPKSLSRALSVLAPAAFGGIHGMATGQGPLDNVPMPRVAPGAAEGYQNMIPPNWTTPAPTPHPIWENWKPLPGTDLGYPG